MLRNGRNIEYAIACGTADTYYRDDTPLHPDGCYVARVSTLGMRPGDTVVACFPSVSTLILDGGDENTVNAVAQLTAQCDGFVFRIEDDPEAYLQYRGR